MHYLYKKTLEFYIIVDYDEQTVWNRGYRPIDGNIWKTEKILEWEELNQEIPPKNLTSAYTWKTEKGAMKHLKEYELIIGIAKVIKLRDTECGKRFINIDHCVCKCKRKAPELINEEEAIKKYKDKKYICPICIKRIRQKRVLKKLKKI